jgi:hypothetical protein
MPHRPNLPRSVFGLLFMLLLLIQPLRAQAQDQPLSLAEYRAELTAAIAELENVTEEEAEATLEALQDHFAAITQVELANGDLVELASILDNLTTFSDEGLYLGDDSRLYTPREVALARLQSAVDQMDTAPTDNSVARLAILQEILARPEFNRPMSLWDRFWQWLENLISQWWPDSQPSSGGGLLAWLIELTPWIISIIIVTAIIWLLSYWLQRLLRSFVTDARRNGLSGDEDLPRSSAEARQQARAAAQSGLYRDAVRRLYLAALLQLAEHDLINYERSLTNREVLARVPSESPIRPHLEPVVATFDQVWYGVHEPDQATFNAYEQEIDALATVAEETAVALTKRGAA